MSGCLNRRSITYFLTALAKFVCRIMIAEYLYSISIFPLMQHVYDSRNISDLRKYADECKEDAQGSFIRDDLSTRESANDYDKASLEMSNNGTFERS